MSISFYFAPKTITRLLEKAGFEVISAKACGKATNLNYIVGVIGKSFRGLPISSAPYSEK